MNEKELVKHSKGKVPEQKGIDKLENYFADNGYKSYEEHIKFLRNLQDLRSTGAAHRKSDKYQKVALEFALENIGLERAFVNILRLSIEFIEYLLNSL